MKKISFLMLFFPVLLMSQSEDLQNWSLNGYVKNLQSFYHINKIVIDVFQPPLILDTSLIYQDNFLHNRLNFNWYLSDKLTFKSDVRTRIFYGELSEILKGFDENTGNDFMDLSMNVVDENGLLFHTMLDRLYLEYQTGKWEFRLGRQRINWGINTFWNPNDVFNAYAFTDFDYEERPGSDALRIKYYTGMASSIELAAKMFDTPEDAVVGLLWKTNKWNYDFQVLTAVVQEELALGGGWAGSLKDVGFKGEFTFFNPFESNIEKSFALAMGADYAFDNGTYVTGGLLYNSNGDVDASFTDLFTFELTAKNLYPFKYALYAQGTYQFNPLLTGGLALIYSPDGVNALFANPTLTYSIHQNWDLDFVGQVIFTEVEKYETPMQAFFLRLKYSF